MKSKYINNKVIYQKPSPIAQFDITTDTLFALLRASLNYDESQWEPTLVPDWSKVYNLAVAHGLIAVAWDGLQKLIGEDRIAENQQPARITKLQWAYSVELIETRYRKQQNAANKLSIILAQEALKVVIFKGLSLSQYYPISIHREYGDIDLYSLEHRFDDVDKLIVNNGGRLGHVSPKHSDILFCSVTIENHRAFVWDFLSSKNTKLNDKLKSTLDSTLPLFGNEFIQRPNLLFDQLFVLAHAANHFKLEGIVLRHVIDWYMILRANDNGYDEALMREYGLDHFARILSRICRECLGADIDENLCKCDTCDYQIVLNDILQRHIEPIAPKSKLGLVYSKFYRFTSRRWTYNIVGDSYLKSIIRTIYAHVLQPMSLFRGVK